MRQVIIFEQHSIADDTYGGTRVVKAEKARGTFHKWGMDLRQVVAIVEMVDGTVEYIAPDMIKFINPVAQRKCGTTVVANTNVLEAA